MSEVVHEDRDGFCTGCEQLGEPVDWLLAEARGHLDERDAMSERVGTLGGDERCHRCGGENVTWFAPSPLWNYVMRGNDINGDPLHGDLVCLRCFVVLAEEVGIKGRWRLTADPEPDGLIYETPSGRTWDAELFRWIESSGGSTVRCSGCNRPIKEAEPGESPYGWVHADENYDGVAGCDNGYVLDGEWVDQTFAAPD